MKQIFKTVAVIALAAVSASCAKERLAAPSGEETLVSFTVSAPVLQTRAIADGNTVDKVACCVYDSEGNYVPGTETTPISQTVTMTSGKADFKVRLVTGQTYSFIFWAYNAAGDHYTLDAANKTVKVNNYTTASNDESRDAFYAYVAPLQITGAYSAEVKLYRPFAQLNFGVEKDDIAAAEAAGITVEQSRVRLTNLATELNLTTGEVDETTTTAVEFALADCPDEDLEVNEKTYGYVAMNYILVGKNDKTLTDTKLTIAKDDKIINTIDVTAVPLQGNYRTNVLGNLFTSAVDLKIVVDPAFKEPDIVKEFVSVTAESIENANALIKANSGSDIIEVKFAAKPEDIAQKAILTSNVKESGTLNIEVSAETEEGTTLYVGDYASDAVAETMPLDESAKAAAVNITIPEGTTIGKVVIAAPTKTVTINGTAVADGTYTIAELEAITSGSTLIIEKGQTVKKLIFHRGGLEIHGTVEAVEIEILAEDKDKDPKEVVIVRDCENLTQAVYDVLKAYIKDGYVSLQNTDGTWNITKPVKMGNASYLTLKEACAAAGSEVAAITLISDVEIAAGEEVTVAAGTNVVLNLNGKNITYGGTSSAIFVKGNLTVNGEGSVDGGKGGNNNTIQVNAGGNLTINGGTFTVGPDANNEGNSTIYSYGGNVSITGGTFSSAAQWGGRYWVVNKKNGTSGVVAISGGKFREFDPANPTTDDDVTYLAEGYRSVRNGEYYEVISAVARVADQDSFDAAVANEGAVVKLAAGTYSVPASIGEGVTIEGVKGTVIECPAAKAYRIKSFEFKNLTLQYPNADYNGFQHVGSIKYENCVITGRPTCYAETIVFENCTFVQTAYDYCIWTYTSDVTFNNCKFNCAGKAVKVYNENGSDDMIYDVTFNGCTFTATGSDSAAAAAGKTADKAAIEIDSRLLKAGKMFNVYVNNCTETGFKAGEFSGETMWNVEGDNATVKVDGEKVYPSAE